MADNVNPEGAEQKPARKKFQIELSRHAMDGVVLVFVPFLIFVVVFLYVLGLVPPRAAVIQVPVAGMPANAEMPHAAGGAPEETPGTAAGRTGLQPGAGGESDSSLGGVDTTTANVAAEMPQELPGNTGDLGSAPDSVNVAADQEKTRRTKQIAKVYEQMNPSSVAAIMTNMPDTDAVAILSVMTPRGAAKVLATLDPGRAARLSLDMAQ